MNFMEGLWASFDHYLVALLASQSSNIWTSFAWAGPQISVTKCIMRIFTLLLFVSTLGVSAETAEEAWNSLLSENFKKREAFAFVENDPSLPNVFIYGDVLEFCS